MIHGLGPFAAASIDVLGRLQVGEDLQHQLHRPSHEVKIVTRTNADPVETELSQTGTAFGNIARDQKTGLRPSNPVTPRDTYALGAILVGLGASWMASPAQKSLWRRLRPTAKCQ